MSKTLRDRISAYLSGGGLFNPELANHEAVRDLLIECRDALADQAQAEPDRRLQLAMQNYERWKSHALELSARLQQYEPGDGMALNAAPQPAAPKVQQ